MNKLIEVLATWFYKQIKKEDYFLTIVLFPLIILFGIFVCIYEEINE